jgi:hypothetical protein
VVPFDVFTEIPPGEYDEDAERDHFLDDFQLKCREFAVADAVCRDLEAVFRERDQPTHDDCGKERSLAVFEGPYQATVMKIFEQSRSRTVFMALESYHGRNDGISVAAAREDYDFRRTSVPAIMSWRACFFSVNPAMM